MEYLKKRKSILQKKRIGHEKREQELKKNIIRSCFFEKVVIGLLEEYKAENLLIYHIITNQPKAKHLEIFLTEDNKQGDILRYILYIGCIDFSNENFGEGNNLKLCLSNSHDPYKSEEVKIDVLTETPEKFRITFNNLFERLDS